MMTVPGSTTRSVVLVWVVSVLGRSPIAVYADEGAARRHVADAGSADVYVEEFALLFDQRVTTK